MISAGLYRRFYGDPGDPRHDGTRLFYTMIRGLARRDSRVLNLGAGPATGEPVRSLKGEVAEVVGADIDPIALSNSELDAAAVIEGGRLPFADASFDLAYADYVLEHVERPVQFLAEVHRVLKHGAAFLFRTPNLFHYVTLLSYATPHWLHERLANQARGLPRDAHKPWPTFYRLNTRHAIRIAAEGAGFARTDLDMVERQPSYLMFHAVPFLAGVAYERLVNSSEMMAGFRANIFGKLTK